VRTHLTLHLRNDARIATVRPHRVTAANEKGLLRQDVAETGHSRSPMPPSQQNDPTFNFVAGRDSAFSEPPRFYAG
jgi:hypothetical protein